MKVLELIFGAQHIILNSLMIKGFAKAQYNCGLCLDKGEDVQIDFKEASHYVTLSADQENAEASNTYGNYLYKGEGVSINFR
jgi:TPR repeat protein